MGFGGFGSFFNFLSLDPKAKSTSDLGLSAPSDCVMAVCYDTRALCPMAISRLRLRTFGFESAAARYFANIPVPSLEALLPPVGRCCPGPRQGVAPGAPGPLPGIANRRALRCPLTRCGQCPWQQASGNLPKGAVCLTWENVVRGGDGRGEPLAAWAVTDIRVAHHTPSIHALIP